MIAHSKRIVGYVLANKRMLIVIAFILLTMSRGLSLLAQKLDEQGICWMKGRGLTNDELYQQAMTDFVQNLLKAVELSRDDRPGMERGEAEGPFWCRKLDCDVWVAPPAKYKQIESLRDKFAKVNMYTNKPPIPELLGWQLVKRADQTGKFKQKDNQLTIVTTVNGGAHYYPVDCCEIYGISNWQKLQRQYPKYEVGRGGFPHQKIHKYLLVKEFLAPEINLNYDGRDGAKYFASQQYARIYGLNACGFLLNKKAINALKIY